MEQIRHVLADNMRRLRERRGVDQNILAELTDSSQAYISQVESGKRWPKPDTIRRIAEALNAEQWELFEAKRSAEETGSAADMLRDLLLVLSQVKNLSVILSIAKKVQKAETQPQGKNAASI